MKLIRLWILCCMYLGFTGVIQAATYLLDDSQSQVMDANMPMQWRSLSPSKGDHQVVGTTRVQVKLDTRAWVDKFVRIYMALPAQPGSTVLAKWQVQGPMIAGQLNSGQRGLVWSGVVPSAVLEDVMTVTVQTDGRFLSAPQLLRFYFEVDVP
jgi:hypothetical protein